MRSIHSFGLTLAAGLLMVSCTGQKPTGMTAEEYLGYNPDEQQLQMGDDIAIAQTQYGKVKGYILHGVYTYLGVPYGASTADAKKVQGAPVYMSLFDYEPNLFNGRMRAFHCADICYWFRNTDVMLTHTGGGKEPRELSKKMSQALLSFMRTGNPNNDLMPEWPEYTPEEGALMLLDTECKVLNDPDREARNAGK